VYCLGSAARADEPVPGPADHPVCEATEGCGAVVRVDRVVWVD
jgi:hypothetical protein